MTWWCFKLLSIASYKRDIFLNLYIQIFWMSLELLMSVWIHPIKNKVASNKDNLQFPNSCESCIFGVNDWMPFSELSIDLSRIKIKWHQTGNFQFLKSCDSYIFRVMDFKKIYQWTFCKKKMTPFLGHFLPLSHKYSQMRILSVFEDDWLIASYKGAEKCNK